MQHLRDDKRMIIKHLDDVLSHLVDGFIHVDKGDYSYIDYVHVGSGFDSHPVLLECRGLIFDKEGNLIRRPLHKFFNLGEKGIFSDSIDWTLPHIVMDKLDGSMISPFMLNGKVRFGTRAGITEHSLRCEAKHLKPELLFWLKQDLCGGLTPIFEWTSFDNQIVLSYPDDKLSLLAMRWNETGQYVSRSQLAFVAKQYGVPLVEERKFNPESFYEQTGIEGVVIWFTDNDYFVKVKTNEYTRAHRAVSFFERESMILPVVLNRGCDDLYPALSVENAARLRTYEAAVWQDVASIAFRIGSIVGTCKPLIANGEMSRKTFALEIAAQADERIRSCYFSILDGKMPIDVVKEKMLKYPELLKIRWKEQTNAN